MAVYQLCGVQRYIPRINLQDKLLSTNIKAVKKVFASGAGPEALRGKNTIKPQDLMWYGGLGMGIAWVIKKIFE